MATYLEICQDVARECGIAGGADESPKPTSVLNQRGELKRVVFWVRKAYKQIQGTRNWRWLRKDFEVNTVAGVDTYAFGIVTDVDDSAFISRFKTWRIDDSRNPPKLFLASAGVASQVFLSYARWDNFEYLYKTGALQTQTAQPFHISVNPKDELILGITPNDVYTLRGSYHKSAQVLTASTDVPEMPEAYHDLIMYQAMEFYGLFESAPEVISRARAGMRVLGNQLNRNQGQAFRLGRPLA